MLEDNAKMAYVHTYIHTGSLRDIVLEDDAKMAQLELKYKRARAAILQIEKIASAPGSILNIDLKVCVLHVCLCTCTQTLSLSLSPSVILQIEKIASAPGRILNKALCV